MQNNSWFKYGATLNYIVMVTLINVGFSWTPVYHLWGQEMSIMDPIAGIIYLVRDFAQRELGHYIFVAMLACGVLSYFLATPQIAIASVSAFMVGEIVDWALFTFTKRPLKDRLLLSACLSTPLDTFVFLWGVDRLNILSMMVMSIGKFTGILLIYYGWRHRYERKQSQSEYQSQ